MKKEEFIPLAKKYNEGLCSPEEQVLYEKIYKELVQEGSLAPNWDEAQREQKRKTILSRIEIKRLEQHQEKIRNRNRVWQIAASVILLIGIGISAYLYKPQEPKINYITKSTTEGQRLNLTLSDGSVIVLNSNSKLTYPEKFSATSREITLQGEAYFEVMRNSAKPFSVSSGDVVTTVLGTSFNIRAFDIENIEVTVNSGKVKVAANAIGKEVVLSKGQQANYSKHLGDITTNEVNPEWYNSWISKSLEFDLMPFKEVVKILEHTYTAKVQIRNSASNECLIRGKYEDEKLTNVLDGLQYVVKFDYHFDESGVIIIDGNGCIN
ncbi:FecR family protein [Chondrinema litorale]|uniref:FecR family protein n=1 Tax=Chondrinema litorale TaxID=2994555 RepID=UPI002543F328|nr:FecR family protein [Chondrinema litorale]UZR98398.1 FecR domain-containing protein [Chondrinema litorale]